MVVALFASLAIFVKMFGYIGGAILLAVGVAIAGTALGAGSVRLGDMIDDIMLSLPIVGRFYARFIRPATYFSEDTRLVFQEAVHLILIDEINALLTKSGLRALAPEVSVPQTRSLI
jgi:hypothetical protein